MNSPVQHIVEAIHRGESPDHSVLLDPEVATDAVEILIGSSSGRRWLRRWPDLPESVARRLLAVAEDFATGKRDRSLDALVSASPLDALHRSSEAIAASPAAHAMWSRFSADGRTTISTASAIVAGDDAQAASTTLYLLVLDPIDPYLIGERGRVEIASAALDSNIVDVRSLAAEYLFDHDMTPLADRWRVLVADRDERIRGLGWSAGLRTATGEAYQLATLMLDDPDEQINVRRSALSAIGTNFDTRDVVDILARYVVHPAADLAVDAGNLLFRLHRHPTIATAAAGSPHQQVREIGEFLLDPYRGSPAAGGSRPGDPTNSDIFAQMIRQTEDRMLEAETDDTP
jgi:hypothetical protein